MNKRIISLMVAALALLSAVGQVTFTGYGQYPPIEVTPETSTSSLKKIFVVYNTDGVSMSYTSPTGERSKWCTFESYPDPIPVQWDGFKTTLKQVMPNTGYIIDDNYYFWVVDYSYYPLELNDIFFVDETPCSLLAFRIDGSAPKILYKNKINGPNQVLDREIKLSYNTLVWDDSTHWEEQEIIETFESLDEEITVNPPLCNTIFTLSGDRFLQEWGIPEAIESQTYQTQAVDCGISVYQELRDNKNEKGLDNGLGGSAPVHIIFTGYPTDAVVYRVWEMATDPDFENIILTYNQDEVDYTFNEAGTYYMRYRVANASGTCENSRETDGPITVSESELVCPNVFSPGSTEGINDVWKVSYKSLVEFHCWIFNRWGTCVCEFTDPGQGWDGTYKGRLVDTGVYYYVVTALGSDGVKYKKRGDITIMRYKKGANGTSGGTDMGGGY